MDIQALRSISSDAVRKAAETAPIGSETVTTEGSSFDDLLTSAMDSLGTTNAYLSDAENEELKWALGETTSTHDLTNALQKASVSLQYTVAVRDKLLEAYKEIMQMQI